MKKLFLVLFAFIALTVNAQEQKTTPTTTKYVSFGLSVSNFNETFSDNSYPSIEVGVTRNDVSYGLVFGRASLRGLGESNDTLSNYFYEVKVTPSVSLGYLNANLILGVGGYINQNRSFVEYGGGLSKTFGNTTYGLSYTNWDGVDYLTPSVSFSF
jgi:hypothetical protein